MASPVLQFKRGILANLPGLRAGEPGFTTDSYDLYVGVTSEVSTNKFFGSHRYWTRETNSTGSGLNLVEGTSNGSNYITLQSPDSLAGIVTYYLPGTQGASSSVLTNDGSGNLTWSSGSDSPVFTGIATFTDTTENTLGDANTGSVQIDGGVGINKNVTVGGNLNVQGYSEFVGVVTFKGGTINLGDDNTDDINIAGEFISNLVPNTDDTYDIGVGDKRWRSANFSGISTFNNVTVGGASTSLLVNGNARIIGALTIGSTSITFSGVNNLITGVTTFTGLSDFNGGINVDGHTELDNLAVSGVSTFTGAVDVNGGTNISGGETILSSATVSDLTSGRIVLAGVSGALEDSPNLTFNGSTLTVEGGIIVNSGVSTYSGLIDANGGLDVSGQVQLNNNLSVVGVSSFAGVVNANGGAIIDNVRIGIADDNEIDTSSGNLTIDSAGGTVTIDDELIVTGDIRINGNDIKSSDGNTNITLTSNTLTSFVGDIKVGGNDIQASDGNVNITMTSNTLTEIKGDLKVTGNDIQSSTGTALTLAGSDVTVVGDLQVSGNDIKASDASVNITMTSNTLTEIKGDLKVTGNDIQASDDSVALTFSSANVTVGGDLTVGGNDIKSSDGTTALTLADSTGAVTTANDLTVSGNLYVSGNTTQVNTAALTVEDRTIDLGIVNGATPASATTWDLGVLFNYHSGGSAKKSAVVWEHGDTRFKFASVIGADTNGTNNDTPQLSVTTFAPIEIGALWVSDCAGTSQVISCTGTERFLENITVDGGSF